MSIYMMVNILFVGSKEELFKETNKNNVEESFIHIVSGGELDE